MGVARDHALSIVRDAFVGTAAADINGDGIEDLVVTGSNLFDLLISGSADGLSLGSYPSSSTLKADAPAVLMDVDGDGSMDVVAHFSVPSGGQAPDPRSRLIVFEGDGVGGLGDQLSLVLSDGQNGFAASYSLGSHPAVLHLAGGDLDRDGYDDLAATGTQAAPPQRQRAGLSAAGGCPEWQRGYLSGGRGGDCTGHCRPGS